MNKINYVAIMTIGCKVSRGMFTPFPEHIGTSLNVPRNAISASTPNIARTPCDGSKILSLYVVCDTSLLYL